MANWCTQVHVTKWGKLSLIGRNVSCSFLTVKYLKIEHNYQLHIVIALAKQQIHQCRFGFRLGKASADKCVLRVSFGTITILTCFTISYVRRATIQFL